MSAAKDLIDVFVGEVRKSSTKMSRYPDKKGAFKMRLLKRFICFIFGLILPDQPAGDASPFWFAVTTPDQVKLIGEFYFMELKEGQKAKIEVLPKTAHGHTARIEPGSALFSSSDPSVVQVRPDPDDPENELKAEIESIDGSNNEAIVVTFQADGKVGDGETLLIGSLDVVATQGDAVVVEIRASVVGEPADASSATQTGNPGVTGAGGLGNGSMETNLNPGDKSNAPIEDPDVVNSEAEKEAAVVLDHDVAPGADVFTADAVELPDVTDDADEAAAALPQAPGEKAPKRRG